MNPTDPGGAPQPWEMQPPPPANEEQPPGYADGSGEGDLVEGGVNAASGMADLADPAGRPLEGAGVFGLATTAAPVLAQFAPPLPPPPPPTPSATSTNYDQSAGNGALNLGSNFLERLRDPPSRG